MPLPDRNRLREYAVKGGHPAARQPAVWHPSSSARRWPPRRRTSRRADDAPTVAILSPRDWAVHAVEGVIAQALVRLRGARRRVP